MPVTYRLLNHSLEDAAGVLAVEAACWDESPHTPQSLLTVMDAREGEMACWLAEDAGRVVGFMHAFLTQGGQGMTWELDLLAVHPDWRRRGIATQLVRRATASAPPQAVRGRALIAPRNIPSAGAFANAGFVTDSAPHAIFEYDVGQDDPAAPAELAEVKLTQTGWRSWNASVARDTITLNEVHTFLYAGLWADGVAGQTPGLLLQAALAHARRRALDIVGAVISLADEGAVMLVRGSGFTSIGDYHVWTCPLPGDGGRAV